MPPRPTHQARASLPAGHRDESTALVVVLMSCQRLSAPRHEIWFNVNTRTRGAEDPCGTVRGRLNGV